ncbi:guanylate-binding protein 2-like [Protopterus annectens]|uniref:guanylate-binding protein 2-like n=1 Tax=Protopterus annectens TaxID=7888 RepID=UPI001CFB638B|nr:guanylate-binding protein 2-like [Protopterus annectens]
MSSPSSSFHADDASDVYAYIAEDFSCKQPEIADYLTSLDDNLPYMKSPEMFIMKEEGQYVLNEDVCSILANVHCFSQVIGIVGKMRLGKSYIMSKFFDEDDGFKVAHTTDPETKGVWVWFRPHPTKKGVLLILLDTEGLHSGEQSWKEDSDIFLIAMLLSSTLIYNTAKVIDSSNVADLDHITQLAQRVRTTQQSGQAAETLLDYLPDYLCFLIRDDQLQQQGSDNDLLCKILPNSVKDYFNHWIILKLPYPVSLLTSSEIKDGFQEKVRSTVTKIRDDLGTIKTLGRNDIYCSPSGLVHFARALTTFLNKDDVVDLSMAVKCMKEAEIEYPHKEALRVFIQSMESVQQYMPLEEEELLERYTAFSYQAFRVFSHHACWLKDRDESNMMLQQLLDDCEAKSKVFYEINKKISTEKSKKEFKHLYEKMLEPLSQFCSQDGWKMFQSKCSLLEAEYKNVKGLGPEKDVVFNDEMDKVKQSMSCTLQLDFLLVMKQSIVRHNTDMEHDINSEKIKKQKEKFLERIKYIGNKKNRDARQILSNRQDEANRKKEHIYVDEITKLKILVKELDTVKEQNKQMKMERDLLKKTIDKYIEDLNHLSEKIKTTPASNRKNQCIFN